MSATEIFQLVRLSRQGTSCISKYTSVLFMYRYVVTRASQCSGRLPVRAWRAQHSFLYMTTNHQVRVMACFTLMMVLLIRVLDCTDVARFFFLGGICVWNLLY